MFEELSETLKNKWQQEGFQKATDIQEQIFQQMKNKESFIAVSPTGTGKTLAYLLPLFLQIEVNHQLQAVVFAPSQELAQQILSVSKEWTKGMGLTIIALIGGANAKRQIEQLKKKPELIIATPGRFLELMKQTAKLKVHNVRWVIYDEADYLLAKQNQSRKDLELIDERMMRDVQKILVAATESKDLKNYLKDQSPNPILLRNSKTNEQQAVHHFLVLTKNRHKVNDLKRLIHLEDFKALVFFERIADLERVAAKLNYEKVPVSVLHSDLSNQERKYAIEQLKNSKVKLLLTTEVAARGIDLPNIPYVVQYHSAKTTHSYIHRSGRTGRMGAKGTVISLVNEQERRDLKKLLVENDIQLEDGKIYNRQLIKVNYESKSESKSRPVRERKSQPRQKNTTKHKK